MSGNDAALGDQTVGLLQRFPAPPRSGSTSQEPRVRSAIGMQEQLPGVLQAVDWIGISAIGVLVVLALAPAGGRMAIHYLDIVLGATATVNCLHLIRGYCARGIRRAVVQMVKASLAWFAAFGGLMAIAYAAGDSREFRGVWGGVWFGSVWVFLCASRLAGRLLLWRWQREGRLVHNVAVLGTGPTAIALARRLQSSNEARVVGVFDASGARVDVDGGSAEGDLLLALIRAGQVDEVILAWPCGSPPEGIRQQLSKLAATLVEVKIDPGLSTLGAPVERFSPIAGLPILTVQGQSPAGWGALFKRAEDLVLTSLLLVLLAPALLLIAVLIKLDSRGPVIFRQDRHGFNNERIVVFKFRTMHHLPEDPDTPQARRNDPRVTRVGAFLRRTSLDELPQLFNVIRGDMSLVGPRPHAVAHNEKYGRLIDRYLARHRMKPGITGWAQVNGWRGETDTLEKMQGRLEYDLFYIANWSPLLDIKVLLLTIPVVVGGANAY